MEKAAFAAGCFWGVEDAFDKLPGVLKTEVGYAGGHAEDPTYEMVCSGATGHAETLELEYDPAIISYEKLLARFWQIHDPGAVFANSSARDMSKNTRNQEATTKLNWTFSEEERQRLRAFLPYPSWLRQFLSAATLFLGGVAQWLQPSRRALPQIKTSRNAGQEPFAKTALTPNRQGPDIGSQYRSVIFYYTPEQKAAAEKSEADEVSRRARNDEKTSIVTEIVPMTKFWRAEDYHQHYVKRTGRGACHI